MAPLLKGGATSGKIITSKEISEAYEKEKKRIPVPKPVNPEVVIDKPAINNPFVTTGEKNIRTQDLIEKGIINPDEKKPDRSDKKTNVRYVGGPPKPIEAPTSDLPFQISASGVPGISPSFEIKAWNPPPKQFNQTVKDYKALEQFNAPTKATSSGPTEVVPIQKIYNITLPGPVGGHVEMNKIYEIFLPGKNIKLTFVTLGERIKILEYIRQIMIQFADGEDIGLQNSSCRNLLSYIKLLEMNPNYYSTIFNNPYRGLPFGLLIYRAGFPIRFDPISQSTVCAKECIGLDLRIYALSIAELCSFTQRDCIHNYDVWRELAYYEYVREEIVKRRRSPNFVAIYAYYMSRNNKIDYFKLKSKALTQKELMTIEYKNYCDRLLKTYMPDEKEAKLQAYSGCTLVMLTEAPTHNLYQWASRSFSVDGIVHKMTSTGFYTAEIWMSILFQIISALYVMQVDGLYIKDMTIEDNIYIKDLVVVEEGNTLGYYKYVIDGISYYVPNYGFVVMIDSNFKDIKPGMTLDIKRQYKIYSNTGQYSIEQLRDGVFLNYRNIISTNSFTKENTLNCVNKPPDNIMKFIETLMLDRETDLGKVICRHFPFYMNNRLGTYLRRDSEIPNLREQITKLHLGELVAEVIEDEVYRWAAYLGQTDKPGIVEIITKESADPYMPSRAFVTREVRIDTIRQYALTERVLQDYGDRSKLAENELLETYIIDKMSIPRL